MAYEETLQIDIEIDQKRETEITTENKKRLIRKNCEKIVPDESDLSSPCTVIFVRH